MNNIPVLSDLNDHQLMVMMVLNVAGMLYGLVKIHSADGNAKQAKDQTVATGNGFASHVLEKLDKLRDGQRVLQESVESIQVTQDDQRTQLRDTQAQLQRAEQRQVEHITFHMKGGR
jgi:hypothetical protein